MFHRLAQQYRSVVHDLVMSLQALASSLKTSGMTASCYVCDDGGEDHGASFVADLGDQHMVRFLVSDYGISWVESRNGRELVKLEGAEAIQELERLSQFLQGLSKGSNELAAKAETNKQAALPPD
ncbi:MAG: DUF1815 family protein [Synechococcus sp. MED-G135]|jgi:hypothetical protein|nr:MAG: DUF1815 family protein [Synechococcus sp. MED-G135]